MTVYLCIRCRKTWRVDNGDMENTPSGSLCKPCLKESFELAARLKKRNPMSYCSCSPLKNSPIDPLAPVFREGAGCADTCVACPGNNQTRGRPSNHRTNCLRVIMRLVFYYVGPIGAKHSFSPRGSDSSLNL